MNSFQAPVRSILTLMRRSDLWYPALRLLLRHIPSRCWKDGFFPPTYYLQYRGSAVYGMPLAQVPSDDFIQYLEWCRDFPGPVR